jgi:hypothetical protein
MVRSVAAIGQTGLLMNKLSEVIDRAVLIAAVEQVADGIVITDINGKFST